MYVIKLKNLLIVCAVILCIITGAAVGIPCALSADSKAGLEHANQVPIIMYHSVLKSAKKGDKYVITPDDFEADLKYITAHGYTPVLMQDLVDYAYNQKPLPPKPIILTFDDGFYNNYTYVYPLLKEYDARAVISIVGAYTDLYTESQDKNPNYGYLAWEDCKELHDSYLVEIQNHSDNFHQVNASRQGCKKKRGESTASYEKAFKDDIGLMQEKIKEHLGFTPTTYTYPFGMISDESTQYVKDLGFKASLSCEEGMNYLTGDPEELYRLKRFLRPQNKSVEQILKKYEKL